jgi:hypothetical protein
MSEHWLTKIGLVTPTNAPPSERFADRMRRLADGASDKRAAFAEEQAQRAHVAARATIEEMAAEGAYAWSIFHVDIVGDPAHPCAGWPMDELVYPRFIELMEADGLRMQRFDEPRGRGLYARWGAEAVAAHTTAVKEIGIDSAALDALSLEAIKAADSGTGTLTAAIRDGVATGWRWRAAAR